MEKPQNQGFVTDAGFFLPMRHGHVSFQS